MGVLGREQKGFGGTGMSSSSSGSATKEDLAMAKWRVSLSTLRLIWKYTDSLEMGSGATQYTCQHHRYIPYSLSKTFISHRIPFPTLTSPSNLRLLIFYPLSTFPLISIPGYEFLSAQFIRFYLVSTSFISPPKFRFGIRPLSCSRDKRDIPHRYYASSSGCRAGCR